MVIKGITEILKFEWVNISLINPERTHIKSEHVSGLKNNDEIDSFKKKAIHSLDENDIQPSIVESRKVEVPGINDKRFDPNIYKNYGHNSLIRIFMPMIEPLSNSVIGTIEVGYQRKYRKYIYEQDVQILKNFIDYAVHALERKKLGLMDKITHEFKSPIFGIRSNASFLQRRICELSPERAIIKLDDILVDCDLLLYQVRQIEYFLGRNTNQTPKLEETVVFRDIIIKTIYQLKPVISEEFGFSLENIHYNSHDSRKIIVYTDKVMLNQVVYNLLMNSIKYSHKDSNKFKIVLEILEEKNFFIIKFKDWGIGIQEKDKNNIFNEGFRSFEAICQDVGGSGLGLTISRTIMKQLGGNLSLVKSQNPTEFHLKIPKKERINNDSFY